MFSLPFTVTKSIDIKKPAAEVFAVLKDFKTWGKWSPWLCTERECPVDIAGSPGHVGHGQKWDGKRIGSGEMKLVEIAENKRLDYELMFLKPFKSQSKVHFELEDKGGQTTVTWHMQGSLPFFLFFLRGMMSAWVGSDYERGLSMLRELLESGSVPTLVDVNGEKEKDGFHYVGVRRECSTRELGPCMEEDFGKLHKLMAEGKLDKPQFSFSMYHRYDLVSERCDYVSGFAYAKAPEKAEEGLAAGQLSAHKAIQVVHKGPYRFLGNGWSAVMAEQRNAKKKPLKAVPMYEIYKTTPDQVSENELVTEIYLPVR